jgi:gliding motility-associated-like protein
VCGDTSTSTASVIIRDYVPIEVIAQNLFLTCDLDSALSVPQASGGYGELSYLWGSGETTPGIWLPGRTNGTYSLTVTDECPKSKVVEVTVNSGCEVIVPNVFSPNNDGENDRFVIEGIIGTRNTVRVFNRWGQPVFEANNYANNWAGGGLSDGTYFYEVTVVGEPKPLIGHLTILSTDRRL